MILVGFFITESFSIELKKIFIMSKITDVNAYSNENIQQNEKVSFVIHKILNRRGILPGELDLLR